MLYVSSVAYPFLRAKAYRKMPSMYQELLPALLKHPLDAHSNVWMNLRIDNLLSSIYPFLFSVDRLQVKWLLLNQLVQETGQTGKEGWCIFNDSIFLLPVFPFTFSIMTPVMLFGLTLTATPPSLLIFTPTLIARIHSRSQNHTIENKRMRLHASCFDQFSFF